MSRIGHIALASCALLLASQAQAQSRDQQYRQLTLVDGRTFIAEILATEAVGLKMQIPQGQTLLSFELLQDMVPTTKEAYDRQVPVKAFLSGDSEGIEQLTLALKQVPSLEVYSGPGGGITPGEAAAAADCGADLDCQGRVFKDLEWMWLVHIEKADEAGLVVRARPSLADRTAKYVSKDQQAAEVWTVAHKAVSLLPPAEVPEALVAALGGASSVVDQPVASGDWSEERVRKLSFVPLPGYTSLAQGDGARFGIGLAAVVPATALWVGVAGKNSTSAGEFIGLSAGGFYALTVVANQALGMQSLSKNKTAIMVTPTDGGGMVHVGLRK